METARSLSDGESGGRAHRSDPPGDMRAVRDRLIILGLRSFAILGIPAVLLSLVRSLEHGWHPIYVLHIAICAVVLGAAVLRGRLSHPLPVSLLLGVLLVLGVAGLFAYGLAGGGILLLATFSILASVVLGTRAGVIACAVSLTAIAALGVAVCTGAMTFSFDLGRYATSVTAWSLALGAFGFLVMMTIVGVGGVHGHMARSVAALRESEGMTRAFVETSKDWIWSIDLQGVHTYSNPAVEAILGYRPDELLGGSCLALLHEDDRKVVEAKLPEWIARKRGWSNLLLRWRHKNGGWRYLESNAVPILDAEGGLTGFRGVDRDVTARKQAEQAIVAERDRAQSYLELASVLFVAVDVDQKVTLINRKGCEVLGYREEEVIGKNWFEKFLPPPDAGAIAAVFRALMAGELEPGEYSENPVRTKSGEERTIAWHNTVLRDTEGRVSGTLSCGQDITERKQAEREVRQLEQQLFQAQKMEAVGQLAGGVAHDFNNLLQAILGFGELASLDADPSGSVHEGLGQVLSAAKRGTTLVQQLLAFSRRQVLQLKELDLGEVVRTLAKIIRRVIGAHIALDIRCEPGLMGVRADRGQIEQILMNLCVNARDAMPDGGRLTIESRTRELDEEFCQANSWAKPGPYVQLSVTDTGCGMDEETQQRIYEPFFTTKANGEGTGLGLSTVYGIVSQHNGLIHVHSEPGTGTTFRIYLPTIGRPWAAIQETLPPPPAGGTETILLAEDDDAVRSVVKCMLETAGYTVLTAHDGKDAIRVFDDNADQVDLLLLDVVMPKLGGRAVFDHVREKRPETRALFVSGYSPADIHTDFVLDEGLQFIQKPYDCDALLRKVRESLDR